MEVNTFTNEDKYYDEEFINNVRTGNDEGEPWDDIPPPKVAPLFHLAKFSQDDFTSIVDPEANSAEEIPALIKTIVDKVEEYGFDGLTIETIMPMYLENFLYDLGKELESKNKTLYVVITPQSMHGDQPAFSKTQFDHLSEVVGGFALMTHGFSKEKPGPNSPISWLREEVSHFCKNPEEASCKKIFLGINWHGTGFKENNEARPVTGEVFFQLVSEFHPEFKWDEEGEEHFFTIKNGEDLSVSIYFPTLKSLSVRLDLATELGVNICLVEIGQGFDYFFDLL
jgi:chitinase domain-containing protein 1